MYLDFLRRWWSTRRRLLTALLLKRNRQHPLKRLGWSRVIKKGAIVRGIVLVVGTILLAARAALGADAAIGLPPGPPPYGPPPSYGPPPYGPPPDVAVPTLFYFWNGLYVGGAGGWGWTSTKGLNASGDFGGAQIGYNYQSGNFVFGVEADGSFANIVTNGVTDPVFGVPGSVGYRDDGLASLRGRFGYAMNGLLFYGTAGGGWIHGRATTLYAAPGNPELVGVTEQNWRGGWAAGGGVEWGFLPNWSVKVEYMHFGVGSTTYFGAFNTGNINVETFKIGVNYLFR
jgi:outer membrane immunogenic protein